MQKVLTDQIHNILPHTSEDKSFNIYAVHIKNTELVHQLSTKTELPFEIFVF